MKIYRIDADKGIVYGMRGLPIKKVCSTGYIQVNSNGRPIGMAHRMIWEHIHGAIPEGLQINHKNGNKADNRLVNLELVTPSENSKHAYTTGLTSAVGVKNGRAKLNTDSVREIKTSMLSVKNLSEKYGVATRTIRSVISGANWGFVQ